MDFKIFICILLISILDPKSFVLNPNTTILEMLSTGEFSSRPFCSCSCSHWNRWVPVSSPSGCWDTWTIWKFPSCSLWCNTCGCCSWHAGVASATGKHRGLSTETTPASYWTSQDLLESDDITVLSYTLCNILTRSIRNYRMPFINISSSNVQ